MTNQEILTEIHWAGSRATEDPLIAELKRRVEEEERVKALIAQSGGLSFAGGLYTVWLNGNQAITRVLADGLDSVAAPPYRFEPESGLS